jgi:glycerol uptake facilitator protein
MSEQPTSKEPEFTLRQRFVSELIGTFLLVFSVATAGASAKLASPGVAHPRSVSDLLFLGLSNGLALFFIILIVGKISGVQINPAVTLGLASAGRFPWRDVPVYLAAQFLGGVVGALTVILVFGHPGITVGHLGATTLGTGVGVWRGAALEGIGTAVLVFAIFGLAEDPRSPSGWSAFGIGMTLATLVMLLAPGTGAALNPARAFGPDFAGLLSGLRVDWPAYFLAYLMFPIVGSVVAGNLYKYIADLPHAKPRPEP